MEETLWVKICGQKQEKSERIYLEVGIPTQKTNASITQTKFKLDKLFSFLDRFPYNNRLFVDGEKHNINSTNSRDIRLKILNVIGKKINPDVTNPKTECLFVRN